MNVSLTPQLEALIEKKVASGLYNSASEVVREALRLLEEQDRIRDIRLARLEREVAVGLEELEQGRSVPFDDSTVDRIKAQGRELLVAERPGKKYR